MLHSILIFGWVYRILIFIDVIYQDTMDLTDLTNMLIKLQLWLCCVTRKTLLQITPIPGIELDQIIQPLIPP